MTDTDLSIQHGDEYAVFYTGGPYDGKVDTRISTDGTWDAQLTVLADFEGSETQLSYTAQAAKKVGSQVQVTYTFDAAASESLEAIEERGEL
jgi:hypothetical protein